MATIPNFPEQFLDEHLGWHNMHMDMRSQSGSGMEFLDFHRNFIRKTLSWYQEQGYNPRRVEPWSSIPMEIKRHPAWSRSLDEAGNRITRNLTSFGSADELGSFIQSSNLHAAIHMLGADVFDDDDFSQVARAPRSTLFYNWHGLIDNWYNQFENRNRG